MPECEGYRAGDLVTLRGVEGMLAPKPMVIRERVVSPHGAVSYEIRLLEDDLSDYRKGYSLTTMVTESEILEGKCRAPDTRRWALSPEKARARALLPPLKPPPSPAPAVVAPVEFGKFIPIVDSLLGELPEKRVEEFVKSPDAALYNKVIKEGYTAEEKRRFVEIVDTLLGELPEKVVRDFVKTPDYEVYKRVIDSEKKAK